MGGTKLFEDMWDLKLYLTGIFSQEVTGDMLYSSKEINPERERCEQPTYLSNDRFITGNDSDSTFEI